MIDVPLNVVKEKIIKQAGLTESEIDERIKEKLTQLSGLISEEGAAHIVANDLGVKLFKTEGVLPIKELTTAARNATVDAKVLRKYEVREFDKNGRQGKVANMMVGDATGRMRVVFWNDQVDIWEKLKEDDVVRLKNPFVKENNGRIEMHLNDRTEVDINPSGVTVDMPAEGRVIRPERELKYLKDLNGQEENVEVLGTIVQVFDPRFFDVCPTCNKRVNDKNECPIHGAVEPMTNYVTSCFLDDGTANLRVTFWKQQSQRLFDLTDEEILKWKDDPTLAEPHKHELLGEIIKLVGRAKKNEQFDRLELTANLVFKDVDPEQELAKLEQKVAKAAPPTQDESTGPKEAPATTTEPDREVKEEDVAFSSADEIESPVVEEEAINLDDIEDLKK